ncbi:MAG: hypothetical protein IPK69_09610 [Phycisphaerales bacterium]|nr:MAG: hypothetical protein IPK69_09610 [Phycisphaerales bacterium]
MEPRRSGKNYAKQADMADNPLFAMEGAMIVETKPGAGSAGLPRGEDLARQLFVSPRVVDHRSFDELAGALRAIVTEAVNQSRSLASVSAEVREIDTRLRDAGRDMQTRVETAVRVIPTLDQRVQKAEESITRATKDLAQKEQSLREIVTRSTTIDEKRISEVVQRQVSSVVDRALAAFATQLAEHAKQAEHSLTTTIESLATRADAHMKALDESRSRAEELSADLVRRFEARAEQIRAHASTTSEEILERARVQAGLIVADAEAKSKVMIEKAQRKAEELEVELARRADARFEESRLAGEEAASALSAELESLASRGTVLLENHETRAARLAEVAGHTREVLEELDLDDLRDLADRLADASIRANRAEATLTDVLSLTRQSAETLAKAEGLSRDLTSLVEQSDQARRHLAGDVLKGAESIDALEARFAETRETQETILAQVPEIEDAVNIMANAICEQKAHLERVAAEATKRQEEALAAVESRVQSSTREAELVTVKLEGLVRKIRESARAKRRTASN